MTIEDAITVYLDPGHGGVGYYGAMYPVYRETEPAASPQIRVARLREHAAHADIVESEITLDIALEVEDMFESSGWPVIVELSRDKDIRLPLAERHAAANMMRADLAISIHVDANHDDKVCGLTSYAKHDDDIGLGVARLAMMTSPSKLHRARHSPIKAYQPTHWTGRAHNVLAGYQMPAALIEMGVATNTKDRKFLMSADGRRQLVLSIMNVIVGARSLIV